VTERRLQNGQPMVRKENVFFILKYIFHTKEQQKDVQNKGYQMILEGNAIFCLHRNAPKILHKNSCWEAGVTTLALAIWQTRPRTGSLGVIV
jgi:hypothetical protein